MEEQSQLREKQIGCAKSDCQAKATHHIVVRLWAYGENVKSSKPMKIVLNVLLCEKHAQHAAKFPLETVINDEFWQMVDLARHASNRMPIDRKTLQTRIVKGSPAQHSMN